MSANRKAPNSSMTKPLFKKIITVSYIEKENLLLGRNMKDIELQNLDKFLDEFSTGKCVPRGKDCS